MRHWFLCVYFINTVEKKCPTLSRSNQTTQTLHLRERVDRILVWITDSAQLAQSIQESCIIQSSSIARLKSNIKVRKDRYDEIQGKVKGRVFLFAGMFA